MEHDVNQQIDAGMCWSRGKVCYVAYSMCCVMVKND